MTTAYHIKKICALNYASLQKELAHQLIIASEIYGSKIPLAKSHLHAF